MTITLEENEAVAYRGGPQVEPKIAIRVKLDGTEDRVVELDRGACVSRILEVVATERGCDIEELVLAREGEGEPLTIGVVVDTGYPNKHPHHVHYTGEVKVTV